ncbi:RLK7, partial [Symbiodinium sp. KB8]
VRDVLESLGLPSWEMPKYDQRNWTGVLWAHQFRDKVYNYDFYQTLAMDPCDVMELHLDNYPLGGRLSSRLAKVPNFRTLRRLSLGNSGITGHIGFLPELTHLAWLYLPNTAVHGDVGYLSHLPELVNLDLSGTGVYGKINDLTNLYSLRQVSGDLGDALLNGAGLADLDLSDTSVHGDVRKLSAVAKDVRKLHLSKTQISGDISGLLDL